MEERRSGFKIGFLCRALIVLVLGLIAYAVLSDYWVSPSLLDAKTEEKTRPSETAEKVGTKAAPIRNIRKIEGDYKRGELDPLFAVLAGPGAKQAAGIRLTGYEGGFADQLAGYVKRMSLMRKNPSLHLGEGTALMLIEQSPLGFDEFLDIAEHLGTVTNKDERIRFIEVAVDKSLLEAPPLPSVLLNPSNSRYVEANVQELSKLDTRRIASAARRLAAVESLPDDVRGAVCDKLIHLLNDPWGNDVDYVRSLAQALAVWGSAKDPLAFRAVSNAVAGLSGARQDVPEACLVFVAGGDPQKAMGVLKPLWRISPAKLEPVIAGMGASAESEVIGVLMEEGVPLDWRCSAVRVLGEVGGRNAVPVLEALQKDKNESLRMFAEGSLRAIEKRGNEHRD